MKKKVAILLALSLLVSLSACGKNNQLERNETEFMGYFDTVTQIVAYTKNKAEFQQQAKMMKADAERYHQLFDIYNNYEGINNIKTINDHAGKGPVQVDKEIIDLLLFSKETYADTEGKMNAAIGAVTVIWHNYREAGIADPENAQVPSEEELRKAAEHIDINDLIIDEAASTIMLRDPQMRLDVGGIAKGYATELISLRAAERGLISGLISVGGNVRAVGAKGAEGDFWNVGVQNPDKSSDKPYLFVANLADLSMVTSGTYERYYTVEGKRYHHIIDPETLFPAEYFDSVTIVTRDSGRADAYTKAIFNLPLAEGQAFIAQLPDTEALWVTFDGEMIYSNGFLDMVGKNTKTIN